MDDVTVWFNPRCSKCRTTRDILGEAGIACELVEYLHDTPAASEIERVLGLLGFDDPRQMMRTDEPDYEELGLADADHDRLISAMIERPTLIQRPIVIRGSRAVIGRPVARVREFLEF